MADLKKLERKLSDEVETLVTNFYEEQSSDDNYSDINYEECEELINEWILPAIQEAIMNFKNSK